MIFTSESHSNIGGDVKQGRPYIPVPVVVVTDCEASGRGEVVVGESLWPLSAQLQLSYKQTHATLYYHRTTTCVSNSYRYYYYEPFREYSINNQ